MQNIPLIVKKLKKADKLNEYARIPVASTKSPLSVKTKDFKFRV